MHLIPVMRSLMLAGLQCKRSRYKCYREIRGGSATTRDKKRRDVWSVTGTVHDYLAVAFVYYHIKPPLVYILDSGWEIGRVTP